MTQRNLFDESDIGIARARREDPATSHSAAAQMEATGKAATQRTIILRAVMTKPGCTSDEIAKASGLDRHIPARRLPELRERGYVINGEVRKSRIGGRPGITWYPTDQAKAQDLVRPTPSAGV